LGTMASRVHWTDAVNRPSREARASRIANKSSADAVFLNGVIARCVVYGALVRNYWGLLYVRSTFCPICDTVGDEGFDSDSLKLDKRGRIVSHRTGDFG
jgi:hypothetical protein